MSNTTDRELNADEIIITTLTFSWFWWIGEYAHVGACGGVEWSWNNHNDFDIDLDECGDYEHYKVVNMCIKMLLPLQHMPKTLCFTMRKPFLDFGHLLIP